MVAWLIEFLWNKALYGCVTRPLLDFSERGLHGYETTWKGHHLQSVVWRDHLILRVEVVVHSHVLHEILFRSSLWLFWTTNLTSQLVCIVTVWLKWSIHNLQSIKHLLLLESKYADNKFTFYLRNSHSHTCLNYYVLKCLASTTMIEKLIQIHVLQVLVEMFMKHDLGSLQDFGQHFAGIYIYTWGHIYMWSNFQRNRIIHNIMCQK